MCLREVRCDRDRRFVRQDRADKIALRIVKDREVEVCEGFVRPCGDCLFD
jgi:hypothetical protein